jgi:hypothetical protein
VLASEASGRTFLAAESINWTTALISLSSAIVGALLGGGVAQAREWWKDRQQRSRVATVLASEILGQADVCVTCGSVANYGEYQLRADQEWTTAMFLSLLPPEPSAYKSLVGQLPLLDPRSVSLVITFYGSVEGAKHISNQYAGERVFPRGHLVVLGNAPRCSGRLGCDG